MASLWEWVLLDLTLQYFLFVTLYLFLEIGDCFIKANFKQIHRAKRALAFEYGNMLA